MKDLAISLWKKRNRKELQTDGRRKDNFKMKKVCGRMQKDSKKKNYVERHKDNSSKGEQIKGVGITNAGYNRAVKEIAENENERKR